MTAGKQASILDTVRHFFVIPAICSARIAARSGTASITANYGCQRSYLHGDPSQQQAAPQFVSHTLHQTATVTPGCCTLLSVHAAVLQIHEARPVGHAEDGYSWQGT